MSGKTKKLLFQISTKKTFRRVGPPPPPRTPLLPPNQPFTHGHDHKVSVYPPRSVQCKRVCMEGPGLEGSDPIRPHPILVTYPFLTCVVRPPPHWLSERLFFLISFLPCLPGPTMGSRCEQGLPITGSPRVTNYGVPPTLPSNSVALVAPIIMFELADPAKQRDRIFAILQALLTPEVRYIDQETVDGD